MSNQNVIESLESALSMARAGKITSVAICFVEVSGNTGDIISHRPMTGGMRDAATLMLTSEDAVGRVPADEVSE